MNISSKSLSLSISISIFRSPFTPLALALSLSFFHSFLNYSKYIEKICSISSISTNIYNKLRSKHNYIYNDIIQKICTTTLFNQIHDWYTREFNVIRYKEYKNTIVYVSTLIIIPKSVLMLHFNHKIIYKIQKKCCNYDKKVSLFRACNRSHYITKLFCIPMFFLLL